MKFILLLGLVSVALANPYGLTDYGHGHGHGYGYGTGYDGYGYHGLSYPNDQSIFSPIYAAVPSSYSGYSTGYPYGGLSSYGGQSAYHPQYAGYPYTQTVSAAVPLGTFVPSHAISSGSISRKRRDSGWGAN